jgi:hypothetical protein
MLPLLNHLFSLWSIPLKVVGNEKEGGSRRWQMIGLGLRPRRSRFVCIIILPHVVFDFMYFRFRPSKAKWIGNVLTIRQNEAKYLLRFLFWITFVCCVIRLFQIKVSGWIAASILKIERYCLRHYMDATMPLAPLGKAQQYCSVFNFPLAFRGLFLQFAAHCLRTPTDSVRQ